MRNPPKGDAFARRRTITARAFVLAHAGGDRPLDLCDGPIASATRRTDLPRAILEGIALQTCEVIAALDARIGLGNDIAVDDGMTAYGCALRAGHGGGSSGVEEAFLPRSAEAERRMCIKRYRTAVDRSPA